MLELSHASAAILLCLGPREALDVLAAEGALACRVAADELMLVSLVGPLDPGPPAARLSGVGGLVVDQSDAFVGWTLGAAARPTRRSPASRRSSSPEPAGFVQGAVGGIPAKAIVEDDRIHVLRQLRPCAPSAPTGWPRPAASCLARATRVSGLFRRRVFLREDEPVPRYDVVVIGGGGHGLATAYYLARGTGFAAWPSSSAATSARAAPAATRPSLRANYKTPETIAFFKASYDLYRSLSRELDYNLLMSRRGLFWLAHSEASLRIQRERALLNQAFGVDTVFLGPDEVGEVCPELDLSAGGKATHPRCLVPPARCDHPPRRRRLGIRAGRAATRRPRAPRSRGDGRDVERGRASASRRPRPDRRRRRRLRGGGWVHAGRGHGRPPASDHDTSAAGVRDRVHTSRSSTGSSPQRTCSSTSRRPRAARCWSARRSSDTRATRPAPPSRSCRRPPRA